MGTDMGRPSKISQLPADAKAWLDQELIKRGFSGYVELEGLLAERGFEVGKSIIGRHGKYLKNRIANIQAATEAARNITEAAADQEDHRSAAVIAMVQADMFEVLLKLQAAGDEGADVADRVKLMSEAALAMSRLTRASIAQKKWATGVREKLNAAKNKAAEEAETIARQAGMTEDEYGAIRAKILGIEVDV